MTHSTRTAMFIPPHLTDRKFPDGSPNPLGEFGQAYGIDTFGSITEELLRNCYHRERLLFWRVVKQLAFFGVRFDTSALQFLNVVQDPSDVKYLWCSPSKGDESLVFPPGLIARSQLGEFGIRTKGCLVGIPAPSITRLHEGHAVLNYLITIGFEVLSLSDLMARLQAKDEQTATEEDQVVSDSEVALKKLDELHSTFIKEDVVNPTLVESLRAVNRRELQVLADIAGMVNLEFRRHTFPYVLDKALSIAISQPQREAALQEVVQLLPKSWLNRVGIAAESLSQNPDDTLLSELEPLWRLVRSLGAGQKPPQVRDAAWMLFNRKIDHWLNGEYPVLREMGEWLGVTRERARQLDLKMTIVLEKFSRCINALKQYLLRNHGCCAIDAVIPADFSQRDRLIALELLQRKDIHGLPDVNLLSLLPRDTIVRKILKPIQQQLEAQLGTVFSEDDLFSAMEGHIRNRRLHPTVLGPLANMMELEFCVRSDDRLVWRGISKSQIASTVLREYKEGLAIYRDAQQLRARLDELVPGLFKTDRAMIASVMNSPDVFLWGWGIYIHRDNIKVDQSVLKKVASWIQQQLRRGIPQIMANAAFLEFEDELVAAGIPNEHALYTCLRIYHSHDFVLPRAPKIFPQGAQYSYTNKEMVERFLEDGPKTMGELRAEFVQKRGWKEHMLAQVLNLSDKIIRSGPSEYALTSQFSVTKERLLPLANYLEMLLNQGVETVSVQVVLRDREAQCYKLGITTPHLLYGMLQVHFPERFDYFRFPHVAKPQTLSRDDVSHRKLVAAYLLECNDIVTKEELRYEFVERRGWTERALDNGLYSQEVLQYTQGTVGEYVHRDVIGWDDQKAAALSEYVEMRLEDLRQRSFPCASVRELFDASALPPLSNGMPWTVELFQAFLEEIDSVLLLGTKHLVVMPLPNSLEVEDDVGFVTFILKQEFGGAAKLEALERRLAALEFCKELPEALRSGRGLPYSLVNDEVILNELRVMRC